MATTTCDPASLHTELVAAFTAAGIATDVFTGVNNRCGVDWTGTETAQHHTIANTVIAAHDPGAHDALVAAARNYLRNIDFADRKAAIEATTLPNAAKVILKKINRTEAAIAVLLLDVIDDLPDE